MYVLNIYRYDRTGTFNYGMAQKAKSEQRELVMIGTAVTTHSQGCHVQELPSLI